jgi:hypothetical protein
VCKRICSTAWATESSRWLRLRSASSLVSPWGCPIEKFGQAPDHPSRFDGLHGRLGCRESQLNRVEHLSLASTGLEKGDRRLFRQELREVFAKLVTLADRGHGLRQAMPGR